MNIIDIINQQKKPYDRILEACYCKILPVVNHTIVSVIIPVHGRIDFSQIVCDHLMVAAINANISVSVTIVEHSEEPLHMDLRRKGCNYIWIPQNGSRFNKCLAHNIGAIANSDCQYFLFHDVDTLVPKDFFTKVMQNMIGKDAVQTFTKRRLLHCDPYITNQYIYGNKIPQFNTNNHTHEAKPGAAGGSIFINKETFLNAGGWDDVFCSEYSIEDQFFFDKMHFVGKFDFCDNPAIELLHLHHEPSFNRVTKSADREYYESFVRLNEGEKRIFLQIQKDHLLKFM